MTAMTGFPVTQQAINVLDSRRAAFSKELCFADGAASGTGASAGGTFATDGNTGGGYSSGDSTSRVYVAGQSILNGIDGYDSIYWNTHWIAYVRWTGALATNSLMRVVVGLKTDTTQDLTGLSGTYAGIQWSSATSAAPFRANAGVATIGGSVTTASISGVVRNHLWIENLGNGTVRFFHATGDTPELPATPTATITGASTTTGGAGFQLQVLGTGASASASFRIQVARFFTLNP